VGISFRPSRACQSQSKMGPCRGVKRGGGVVVLLLNPKIYAEFCRWIPVKIAGPTLRFRRIHWVQPLDRFGRILRKVRATKAELLAS